MTAVLPAEDAYVGSLLWLDAATVREAHGWLTEDDITRPALQLVHRMAGQLAAANVRPDPTAVLALAMYREEVVGEHHTQVLTGHLCRLYDHRATNPASVRWYAVAALSDAIRRRTAEMATRLAQVADHADLDELDRLTRAELAAVDAIRRRRDALATEGTVLAA